MRTILVLFLLVFSLSTQAQAQTKVAPYYTPGVGTQDLTTTATTDTSIDLLASGSMTRMQIPFNGSISKIAVYLGDTTNLTGIYFANNTCTTNAAQACTVFTPTYTAVINGPFTSSAVNIFTLATPLAVSKYDVLSMRAEWSAPHAINLALLSSQLFPAVSVGLATTQPETCYFKLNQAKPSTYTISGMTLIPNAGCPVIGAYMDSPKMVGIGNSIMGGAPAPNESVADAFTEHFPIPATYGPIHFWTADYLPVAPTYQDMGISGQRTNEIDARFAADVTALSPNIALFDGGVNDLLLCNSGSGCTGGQISSIEANITSVMSKAQAAGIRLFVMLIGPWSTSPNGSNARMTSADTINANTIATAPTYGATIIDWRCTLGQFRSGGSGGNCWDWQAAYLLNDTLGVHPNQSGMALIGNLIFANLTRISSNSAASGGSGGF